MTKTHTKKKTCVIPRSRSPRFQTCLNKNLPLCYSCMSGEPPPPPCNRALASIIRNRTGLRQGAPFLDYYMQSASQTHSSPWLPLIGVEFFFTVSTACRIIFRSAAPTANTSRSITTAFRPGSEWPKFVQGKTGHLPLPQLPSTLSTGTRRHRLSTPLSLATKSCPKIKLTTKIPLHVPP